MVNGLIRDGPFWIIDRMLGLELVQPADPRPDQHPALVGGGLGKIDSRMLYRGLRGHQGELREVVKVARLLDPEAGHRIQSRICPPK